MKSREDKPRVFAGDRPASAPVPDDVLAPSRKIFDTDRGLPLYWAERKPVNVWADILWS